MADQRWWHSFEEDHDDVAVYRPDGFDFPPARGRRGIEIDPDGSVVELGLGADDVPGRRLLESTGSPPLEIVHRGDERIEVRRR
ncbi:hypothetical protein [Nocardia sp. 348MFTsu5.1]|uniref:hypothetical protein n=1 Tax=Nocardia sp. 348MFTsu5.1 TaxID=1172185 RepID=UPI001E2B395C|nr:hypothetical protein [Nocardia sp. 348MFTsu5.1]